MSVDRVGVGTPSAVGDIGSALGTRPAEMVELRMGINEDVIPVRRALKTEVATTLSALANIRVSGGHGGEGRRCR